MQFPARRPFPHAEDQLRMRANVLRVRRRTSACGGIFSACGDPTPHAELPSQRAETLLRMRNCLLGVRRRSYLRMHAEMHFSACGDYPRMRRCTSRRAETTRRLPPHAEMHFSACGDYTPACGDALLGVRRLPPHAEMHFSACGDYLRMRRCTSRRAQTLLRMRR